MKAVKDRRLIIGVDGGGTHTVAVAAAMDGVVVDVACGKGINYNAIGMDQARENLFHLLEGMPRVQAQGYRKICVGMSALDESASEMTTRAFAGKVFDAEKLDLQSDAYVALMGLTLGGPGLIVICGTGSMLLMMDTEGMQHVRGGWGYLLGDRGSGYALAMDGLRAAIDAWEGVGPATCLTEAALNAFSLSSPRKLIDRIYCPEATPGQIASFAREVLALMPADPVAEAIVHQNMRHVARQAAQMLSARPKVTKVGLYGGIFVHHPEVFSLFERQLLALAPSAKVSYPADPPELGALVHMFKAMGTLEEATLVRMRDSYRNFGALNPERHSHLLGVQG